MSAKIEWRNLRSWEGSQQKAFEELCAQLASCEHPGPQGATFIRKGEPDAGIECYWKLPSGDELGWQAKFFLSSPMSGQWAQITDSVKNALNKHPNLVRYTVCLPIDRPDPRSKNKASFMERWNKYVGKWKALAKAKQMSVEFDYWGQHEISSRLALEEHAGRLFFWFNEPFLSMEWFENHINIAHDSAGPRYTPEINVELGIAMAFDGLGRTQEFFDIITEKCSKIARRWRRLEHTRFPDPLSDIFAQLDELMTELLKVLESLVSPSLLDDLPFETIRKHCKKAEDLAYTCSGELRKIAEEREKERAREESPGQSSTPQASAIAEFAYERGNLQNLCFELADLYHFSEDSEARLANRPALLITGDAGTGKTHLLCDIARKRMSKNLPTLLFLGEHFRDDDPWAQMIRRADLPCHRAEVFLGALDAAARARNCRALIMIDALNEGEGKLLWPKYLREVLAILQRHPRIAIAITVRESYREVIVPPDLVPEKLDRLFHHGFVGHEYDASSTFFEYYKIHRPAVPLLNPEFQNPLFLKLVCQGLKNRGESILPAGFSGITELFNFFIDSVNSKLSDVLDLDKKDNKVQRAVQSLAKEMAKRKEQWLTREQASKIVNKLLPDRGFHDGLFFNMVSEGILAEDLLWDKRKNKYVEGIHFSYERLSDHLIARYLLDTFLKKSKTKECFAKKQPLGSFLKDENTACMNRGLIEAFLIQIPERLGKELIELAPHCKDYRPVREAFIQSLVWREPQPLRRVSLKYINEYIFSYEHTLELFLDALLTVATNPRHPLNADFLHRNLQAWSMPERDQIWSMFIHSVSGHLKPAT